jgi:hypothetical protein
LVDIPVDDKADSSRLTPIGPRRLIAKMKNITGNNRMAIS